MKSRDQILKDYEYGASILGNQSYIAVYKKMVKSIGLINAVTLSLLYNYAIFYFMKDTLDEEDGYFFKSMNSLEIELNISPHMIRNSLKELQKRGLVDYKRKGSPPKLYFYINVYRVRDLIIENNETKR